MAEQTYPLLLDAPTPTIAEVSKSLPGRENEINKILGHIGDVNNPMPPLFIYGPANTGKTSTVLRIFESLNRPLVYVNCAEFETPPTRLLNYNPKKIVHGNAPPIFENILRGISYLENRHKIGHPGVLRKNIINNFMDLFKTSLENTVNSLDGADYQGKMVYLVIDHLQVLHQWFGSRSVAAHLISSLCHDLPNLGVVLVSSNPRVPTKTWKVSHRVRFTPYEDRDAWIRQMEAADLDDAVAAFKDRTVPPKLLGFRCSVHHLDQKDEGICMAVSTAGAMVGENGNSYHTKRAAKAAIVSCFGAGGSRIPMIGRCRMGTLRNTTTAFKALQQTPFQHSSKQRHKLMKDGLHEVTVTGVDTRSDNPKKHALIVKNSWGKPWGARGRTKVSFSFLDSVSELNSR